MRMDVLIGKIWGVLDYNIKYSNVNGVGKGMWSATTLHWWVIGVIWSTGC